MKLLVKRVSLRKDCTIGYLFIDGVDSGLVTLEPVVRDHKIPGVTAIPSGQYKVIVDYSNHFGRLLPHLLGVPNFEGVRIHPGNSDKDTEGCILVGKEWPGGDFIGKSKEAFDELFAQIVNAEDGVVEIEIT